METRLSKHTLTHDDGESGHNADDLDVDDVKEEVESGHLVVSILLGLPVETAQENHRWFTIKLTWMMMIMTIGDYRWLSVIICDLQLN